MMKKKTLPRATLNLINLFFQLPIAGKKIRCPYFKHKKKLAEKKFKKRVFIGKGHPQEIKNVTEARIEGSKCKSAKEIREIMKKNGLGIDCSGFVSWILDSWSQGKREGKHFWREINISPIGLKGIRYFLRPVENLDVKTIIGNKKSRQINNPTKIEPGDLIHLGRDHLLIVDQVVKDAKKRTTTIFYVHASDFYDGVHKGLIKITNFKDGLEKQKWIEKGKKQNWSHERYLNTKKSGVVRLELFKSGENN